MFLIWLYHYNLFSKVCSFFNKKNILNTTFYLNVTETKILLEDENMNCRQKKKRRKLGAISGLSLVYPILNIHNLN